MLAVTDAQWGLITTGTLGIASVVGSVYLWNQRFRHERDIRRDDRRHDRDLRRGDRRADAYLDAAAILIDIMGRIERQAQQVSEVDEPPITDQELAMMQAKLEVYGTEETLELFKRAGDKLVAFWPIQAQALDARERAHPVTGSDEAVELQIRVSEAYEEAQEATDRFNARCRQELAS